MGQRLKFEKQHGIDSMVTLTHFRCGAVTMSCLARRRPCASGNRRESGFYLKFGKVTFRQHVHKGAFQMSGVAVRKRVARKDIKAHARNKLFIYAPWSPPRFSTDSVCPSKRHTGVLQQLVYVQAILCNGEQHRRLSGCYNPIQS